MEVKRRLLEEAGLHTIVRMPQSVFAPYTPITTNILFFENGKASQGVWFYRMDMPEGYKHFSKTKPIRIEHFDEVKEWWADRQEIVDETGNPKAKLYLPGELAENGYNFDLCGYPHEEEEILPPDELIKAYKEERARLDEAIDIKLNEICAILGIEL